MTPSRRARHSAAPRISSTSRPPPSCDGAPPRAGYREPAAACSANAGYFMHSSSVSQDSRALIFSWKIGPKVTASFSLPKIDSISA
jgi:hypothetical protein